VALPFHHPAWSRLIADCYGYRGFVVAVGGDGGRLVAGVPVIDVSTRLTGRKWVSLPFTDFCPPVVGDGGAVEELVGALDAERRAAGVTRLEVRADVPGAGVARRSRFVVHRLELDHDPDAISRRLRSEHRRKIKLARSQGVAVRVASERSELVDVFYGLHLGTRRRQGVPIQPKRFFELLWERIIEPGLGVCLLAFAHGAPLAGAVMLAWNHTVTGKYYASDARFWGLRPNHLLYWEAIAWSCERGFLEFDFGRSDLDNAGLRSFKSSWGAREEPLVYCTLGDPGGGRRARRPAAALGTIIRHSPPALCRTVGELFYKYAV
jgi:CelD/BcsL family acetyltransferase involved in cellulose biosynthesis